MAEGPAHGHHRRLTRRDCLRLGASGAFAWLAAPLLAGCASTGAADGDPGAHPVSGPDELLPPDANGLRLRPGFRSRIVARSGERPVAASDYAWHGAPDGGATFPTPDGGWIYVSNAELPRGAGGVGALRFDRRGTLVDAYPILAGSSINCAGGPTPWGTWLSCEEHPAGLVHECDPAGSTAAVARPALGVFQHEAVAVDPRQGRLYLTEDVPDGCWYRYTPARRARDGRPDLTEGVLEAARVREDGRVQWLRVPDPSGTTAATRLQVPEATRFDGGEGCWQANGYVWFTTKGDDRVWRYELATGRLAVVYHRATSTTPVLAGVDNVTVLPGGRDALVAEDAADMQLVIVRTDGRATPLLQVDGHPRSEVTGPAFSPDGRRLYFSSQRGAAGRNGDGVTYEVTGPFA